jgi:hypothetical protein
MMFHGDLDHDLRAGLEVRLREVRERDVFLQHGRPGARRRVADLRAAGLDWQAATHGHGRNLRRKPHLGIESLEPFPVDVEADEFPARSFAVLALERAPADEVAGLVEVDGPAEAHLVR